MPGSALIRVSDDLRSLDGATAVGLCLLAPAPTGSDGVDAALASLVENVLVDRFVVKDITARIYVIGGAAAGMAYYPEGVDRRASSDIDALFSPEGPVLAEAADVADEHGLPPDWFNGAAGQFIPPTGEPPGDPFITRGPVTVTIAPPEFLLAAVARDQLLGPSSVALR